MRKLRVAWLIAASLWLYSLAPAAVAQTDPARESFIRGLTDPQVVESVIVAWNPPAAYEAMVREHVTAIFAHQRFADYIADHFLPNLDVAIRMSSATRQQFIESMAAAAMQGLQLGGLPRLSDDELLFFYTVVSYSMERATMSDCARIARQEMPDVEMSQWEIRTIFTLQKEYANLYLQTVRAAMFSELSGNPPVRSLSPSQKNAAELILMQRVMDLIETGDMSGAIAYPAAASDADLCRDVRALSDVSAHGTD